MSLAQKALGEIVRKGHRMIRVFSENDEPLYWVEWKCIASSTVEEKLVQLEMSFMILAEQIREKELPRRQP